MWQPWGPAVLQGRLFLRRCRVDSSEGPAVLQGRLFGNGVHGESALCAVDDEGSVDDEGGGQVSIPLKVLIGYAALVAVALIAGRIASDAAFSQVLRAELPLLLLQLPFAIICVYGRDWVLRWGEKPSPPDHDVRH
ncbi:MULTISPECIES: hypothetical protein [unclassified Actinobaculum]|uniref:hypothetical protein n=1 Tax=unclassified Actinobaculum TaxID=2609299 RepID=UPI000D5258FC|nr:MULTISPECIES: hypothetical protein [unclassified Actinobaculum]AWE41785.1 hypothetical protein DDD63_02330 [Actinobaculum sp. 313]RTE50296.1 hypothetical protein EKN07_03570 [Actinobaculum sp. 352]